MYLHELIESIDPILREKAEAFLKSKTFVSLKDFEGGYEAFICNKGNILMPQVVFAHDYTLLDSECQCQDAADGNLCVHITAMLLGIEVMLRADCYDYHTAVAILEQE